MTRPFQKWTVLPHGKVSKIDDNILTVTGQIRMPLMKLPRRMTVVRLSGSRLIVFSAIALDEKQMVSLEEFGRPAFLIVPSDKHRLDAKIWKNRYPQMQVITPQGSRAKVERIVPVNTVTPDFDDVNVHFVTVPGTREQESALVVRTSAGTTLVLNDIVGNIRNASGIGGWLLGLAGFAGSKAQIPRVVKLAMIDDVNALRVQLLQWAEIESLKCILVSHGSPIETNPRETLRDLAASLVESAPTGQHPLTTT
jgi:hypothetical protein